MDWNHDGKQDHQDHAFYNNVVEPGMNNHSAHSGGASHSRTSDDTQNSHCGSESGGKGWVVFIGICIFYLLIKLIGD